MLAGLLDTFEDLVADETCRGIVLTGGHGAFCSGGDIAHMKSDRKILESRNGIWRNIKITRCIVAGPKPVIAAVEEPAAGAGLALAAASDYVVSARGARYSAAFAKVGLAPDLGLFWTPPQRVGVGRVKRLIMMANMIRAEEALAIGIADELCDDGAALDRALQVAGDFASSAPLAVALTKAIYADGAAGSVGDCFRAERDSQPFLFRSNDHKEAVAAFREKRKPDFTAT